MPARASVRFEQQAYFFVIADGFNVAAGGFAEFSALYHLCWHHSLNFSLEPVVTTETILILMNDQTQRKSERFWAVGGAFGALLASSCCIAPLLLVTLGVSGAWIGNLTALEPYKPYFIGITVIFLALGFWHVYFRKAVACEDGSYCARPSSSIITKSALWFATVIVAFTATIDWWAPLFY